jgi:two-component system, sensor histidine kinase PdtaS
VSYRLKDNGWTLSVMDTGCGMATGAMAVKPGLGTSIVEALARQLEAGVHIADDKSGTTVTIDHVASLDGTEFTVAA